MQEPHDLVPYDGEQSQLQLSQAEVDSLLATYEDGLPPLTWDPYTLDTLDDLPTDVFPGPDEALALLTPYNALVDVQFLRHAELDAAGQVTGYVVQYVEVREDFNENPVGRLLDVGRYTDADQATEAHLRLQELITDGALSLDELPLLAASVAEENGLPPDDWRTADFGAQADGTFPTHSDRTPDPDVPPERVAAEPEFAGNIFRETTPDPEAAAAEQARLAHEQALAALKGIGLVTSSDFDLSRDSFYDPECGERVVNGIFQKDLSDPAANCRPMLVSLTTGQDGMGFDAQAVEFGRVGNFTDAQAEHDRVQKALEQGGVLSGLNTIEGIEAARLEQEHAPVTEVSGWSQDII